MEITIDQEAVQTEVVQAIVNSGLGEKIQTAVNDAMRGRFGGDGIIEQAVKAEVHEQVRVECRKLIREPGEVHDLIVKTLKDHLTPEAIEQIVNRFVTSLGMVRAEDLGA